MNYRGGGRILLLALTKWVTGGGGDVLNSLSNSVLKRSVRKQKTDKMKW